jgi:hypothetical protein
MSLALSRDFIHERGIVVDDEFFTAGVTAKSTHFIEVCRGSFSPNWPFLIATAFMNCSYSTDTSSNRPTIMTSSCAGDTESRDESNL